MDSLDLANLARQFSLIKPRFIGVHAADKFPKQYRNTCQFVNTSTSDKPGSHWVLLAKRHDSATNEIIFCDPLGFPANYYTAIYSRLSVMYDKIRDLIRIPFQPYDSDLCGLYVIYLCHCVYSSTFPMIPMIDDVNLKRFIYDNISK